MSRILGIDYGEKRVGVALSDETETLASGRGVLKKSGIMDALRALIAENCVDRVVLGMPNNLDGTDSQMSARVRSFGDALSERFPVKIDYWDERLTSVAAEAALREQRIRPARMKQLIDEMSAILILQSYLDSKKTKTE